MSSSKAIVAIMNADADAISGYALIIISLNPTPSSYTSSPGTRDTCSTPPHLLVDGLLSKDESSVEYSAKASSSPPLSRILYRAAASRSH